MEERLFCLSKVTTSHPNSENMNESLEYLQKNFGLVVLDHDATTLPLARFLADLMNSVRRTAFKMKLGDVYINIPPCYLLLRYLSEVLCITIVLPSTRSRIRVFRPSTHSRMHVALLHIHLSFEQISTFSPLTCSLAPTTSLQPVERQPRLTATSSRSSVECAIFRDTKRPNQKRSYPSCITREVERRCLQEAW
jgi:hypothetical protein